jgi:alkaline phosphatase
MKKFIPTLLTSLMLMSCGQLQALDNTKTITIEDAAPKNIIMVIGDGMGPAYTSAYRYFHDNPNTDAIEQTVFDRHLIGSSSTYPARISGYVTDSAASGTALATATKSYNGAIGVDVNKKPVESVLVWAKKQGKKTGMVVTSQINHATPASYLAHNESRNNYNEIADSFLQAADNIDVLLGGGWQYFIRKDANLVNGFKNKGFNYIDNYNQLNQLPSGEKVLGLFADKGLPWALDDSHKHRLSAMTKSAIAQLENEQGFFMLVEASQIDWGGHSNDIASAMAEMDDLAKTLEYLESYVAKNPNTLVILTADHSTGGFSIGKDGDYLWQPSVLRSMKMSPETIGNILANEQIVKAKVSEMLNFVITDGEFDALKVAKANSEKALTEHQKLSVTEKMNVRTPSVQRAMHLSVNNIIDQRTVTGWTTFGHTAVDVPVFAMGKQKELFQGLSDNTEIAQKIFQLLGKK